MGNMLHFVPVRTSIPGGSMAETAKITRKGTAGTPAKSGERCPPSAVNDLPARDDLVAMYRDMLLIRRFEEKAGQLYGMGQIGGFCHLYIGQEAVVVGLQSVKSPAIPLLRPTATMVICWPAAWTLTV